MILGYQPVRRMSARLGQMEYLPGSTRFVVVDSHGRPVKGADVRVLGSQEMPGANVTDGRGVTAMLLKPGTYDIDVVFGPDFLHFSKRVEIPAKGDVWITLPSCAQQPIATLPEILTLLAGAAAVGAGYYWKIEPVRVTGEVLIGASIFTAIYRLSCL